MATVYLGRALGPGGFERFVAIKVMHPHLAADPDFVTAFLDEARLAARVRHPNVVSTLDVDAAEDGLFLVMDYVDGETLYAIHKRLKVTKARMPLPLVLRIMIDALAGLHAAHELTSGDGKPLQLVHRDVSPQNIIVGYDGITRIGDFGVARAESRLSAATHTGQVKGKYGYMSIEQLRAKTVDRRSDVYSAGVVMWELLAGERLFKGENEAAIALAAAAGVVQSPQDVDPDVPQALDEVVMRALSRAPEGRYESAAAFSEALEDAAEACAIRPARPREISEFLEHMAEDAPTEVRPNALLELSRRLRARSAARAGKADDIDTDRIVFDDPESVTDQVPSSAVPLLIAPPTEARPAGSGFGARPTSGEAIEEASSSSSPNDDAAPAGATPAPGATAEHPSHDGGADPALRSRAVARRPTPVELHALTPSYPTSAAGTLVTTNYPVPQTGSRRRLVIAALALASTASALTLAWLLRSPADLEEPAGGVTGVSAAETTADAPQVGEAGESAPVPPTATTAPAAAKPPSPAKAPAASAQPTATAKPAVVPPAPSSTATAKKKKPPAAPKSGGADSKPSSSEPFQPKLL
jgi:serine/threonine-protein kinase